MKDLLDTILIIAYNLALIVGTVWLVQFYDWNPWWFLLTCLLLASKSSKDKK
jgi:hypothetical protein